VEKCVTCQYYDRRNATPGEGKTATWGQCRRAAPMLHPVNIKSYFIEGVWPHVRDDDWCGEWKVTPRRVAPGAGQAAPGPLVSPAAAGPRVNITPLPAPIAASRNGAD
jgi:hypothetical protein